MPTRKQISLASLFVTMAGGALLGSPAPAAAASSADGPCPSVEEYCQIIADTYCEHGARCTYLQSTCEIINTECIH
ncbi:MAG TPA: hypothetical protein VFH27_15970 [Longimicrobiaceae bacterium]|nr:hypothetical protein [Longimicrobiaceae bacterium]